MRPEGPAGAAREPAATSEVAVADVYAVRAQLERPPRGMVAVAHRCPCGLPDVVATAPRLPDGTPFPTTYYLTCPRLSAAVSTLESVGVMRAMQERLSGDPTLAQRYRLAHEDYLRRRAGLGGDEVPEIAGVSAGGMPDRVKCLHALVGHALAAGPGVNPFGDEVLTMLAGTDRHVPCVTVPVGGTRRVAAIDCGTNSLRLLVADVSSPGPGGTASIEDVERTMEVVRLGQGVDRTGRLDDEALAHTLAVVERYATRIEELGATSVRFAATSATRDAGNRQVFVDGVRERLGVGPEVVSGDEEARLAFRGALAGLPGLSDDSAPVLVLDIGGGSTEFVLGGVNGDPTAACSVDVGCVRMAERHFHHDPPLPSEVRLARDDIDEAIRAAAASVPVRRARTLVGVAGTVTTVAALALRLPEYDAAAIHGSVIDAAEVHRITEQLLYMTREKRAALPVMHPGRVDVIAAGALVLSAVVAHTGHASLVASEHDILDGLALDLALTRPAGEPLPPDDD